MDNTSHPLPDTVEAFSASDCCIKAANCYHKFFISAAMTLLTPAWPEALAVFCSLMYSTFLGLAFLFSLCIQHIYACADSGFCSTLSVHFFISYPILANHV